MGTAGNSGGWGAGPPGGDQSGSARASLDRPPAPSITSLGLKMITQVVIELHGVGVSNVLLGRVRSD